MIDIHSHIIYGIDDGSESIEMSLEMLRLAAAAGTTDIVASPHSNGIFQFQPPLNLARIDEMQALAPDLTFVTRLTNPAVFADVSTDRALKVLVYRAADGPGAPVDLKVSEYFTPA